MSEEDVSATGPKRPPRKGGRPIGDTLGGILAGFDQQILRQQPPAHELVLKGSRIRGSIGADGSELVLGFPSDPVDKGLDARNEADPPTTTS